MTKSFNTEGEAERCVLVPLAVLVMLQPPPSKLVQLLFSSHDHKQPQSLCIKRVLDILFRRGLSKGDQSDCWWITCDPLPPCLFVVIFMAIHSLHFEAQHRCTQSKRCCSCSLLVLKLSRLSQTSYAQLLPSIGTGSNAPHCSVLHWETHSPVSDLLE